MINDVRTRYRVSEGQHFSLSDIDSAGTGDGALTKESAQRALKKRAEELAGLQERLYAEHRRGLLVILQGMDTSGKDGVVEHVMKGVNPLGCSAHSFKAPTQQELDHGYLWRSQVKIPSRGHIGIFNRSYYEDVLAVRVRAGALAEEDIPPGLVKDDIWQRRFADIRAFEDYLGNIGIVPLKFMLHISKDEQKRRLLARADDPEKRWKFNPADVVDRRLWLDYEAAYEDAIRHTATANAPWYIVPSDRKWFSRLVVGSVIVEALRKLDPRFPEPTPADLAAIATARQELLAEE
jgi:PPK2 family polyphosphate:nucleotide phosphotransferase